MMRSMEAFRNRLPAARLLRALFVTILWTGCLLSAAADQVEAPADEIDEIGEMDETEVVVDDEITVRARPLRQIEGRAIEEERRSLPILDLAPSDQLGRFPDRDAAGAARRLPGVTVIADQGDARLVLVRGLLPSYNSATLDGQRMPAGEADERVVALDLLPTELLEAVELTKTLTPSMDGDAVGGTIDLVTRRPPADRGSSLSASLGTGWDDGSDGRRRLATATVGGWLSARRLGASLSASRLDADRGIDSVETEWRGDGAETQVESERLQDHTSERMRSGVGGSLEWHPAPGATLLLRSLRAELDDLERRRARVFRAESEDEEAALLSELKDRDESQTLESLSVSGQFRLGDWLVEPALSRSRGEEEEPDRLDTIFATAPVGGPPEDYELVAFRTESDRSSNEDLAARIDLSRSLGRGPWNGWTVQTGAKWRRKDARRDDNLVVFELGRGAEPVLLSEIHDADWRPADPFLGRPGVDLGPFARPQAARDLFRRLLSSGAVLGRRDPEDDLGDFESEEEVSAAYVQFEGALTDRLSILAGLRAEETRTRYRASELLPDENEEEIAKTPVRGTGSYEELLPSVILRAAPTERDALRAALTRGLARPNLADLTPARLVMAEDEEILTGNPALVPTTSWNLDLQWQRGLEPLGSWSVSLYRKQLSDVIAFVRSAADDDGDSLTVIQPRNAGDGSVTGVEMSYRQRFRGLGVSANLTWAESEARLQGHRTTRLPGQAVVSGNLVLSHETPRASLRWLYSYRDDILEELGEAAEPDLYLEQRGQLDVSLQVRATRKWSVFLEAFNLTREDVRRHERSASGPARPVLEERIGWWASVGLRFDG